MVGPTTAERVGLYLRIDPGSDGLADTIAAVSALLTRSIDPEGEAGAWSDAQAHGATMLAARVYRRRNSPAGIESLGEMGPTYVSRYDPDLDMMLGFGRWQSPKVG